MILKLISCALLFKVLQGYNALLPADSLLQYLPFLMVGYFGKLWYQKKDMGIMSVLKIALIYGWSKSLVDVGVYRAGISLPLWGEVVIVYSCLLISVWVSLYGWSGISFGAACLYHGVIEAGKFLISPVKKYLKARDQRAFRQQERTMQEVDTLGNNGKDFEEFVAGLFEKMGYLAKSTTTLRAERNLPEEVLSNPGSGEYGADVLVWPKLGKKLILKGVECEGLLIQCKQYGENTTLGNKEIQEPYGAVPMYSRHFKTRFVPVLVTNKQEVSAQGRKLARVNNVILIEREELYQLMGDSVSVPLAA